MIRPTAEASAFSVIEMNGSAGSVLLVSNDPGLRELVTSRRPLDVELTCCGVGEAINGEFEQIWVDVDASRAPDSLTSAHRASCVFFDGDRRALLHAPPAPVVLRKPCSPERIDQLWATVRPQRRADDRDCPSGALSPLPGWVYELLEIELRTLSQKICVLLPEKLGYANCSVYVSEPNGQVLTLAACNHTRHLEATVQLGKASGSLMATVARLRHTREAETAARLRAELGLEAHARYAYPDGACLIAPLVSHDHLWGVLNLSGRLAAAGGAECSARFERDAIFTFVARVLEHALLHERVRKEARIDGLTGLYNQRGMEEALRREIQRAQRYGSALSLLMIDLDGLKMVNDTHGHAAGDALLCHIAGRIIAVLRQFDSAARVGGDEFLVMLPSTVLTGAWHVAQRLLASIRAEAATYVSVALPITASIGVAEWGPGWDVRKLIDVTDRAMYSAKAAGGDRAMGPCATSIVPRPAVVATRSVRSRLPTRRPVAGSGRPRPPS